MKGQSNLLALVPRWILLYSGKIASLTAFAPLAELQKLIHQRSCRRRGSQWSANRRRIHSLMISSGDNQMVT